MVFPIVRSGCRCAADFLSKTYGGILYEKKINIVKRGEKNGIYIEILNVRNFDEENYDEAWLTVRVVKHPVEGLSEELKDEINNIKGDNKINNRMAEIRNYGGKLSFDGRFRNNTDTFKRNLTMVDRDMPEIFADMLLHFYYNRGSGNEGIGNETGILSNSICLIIRN